MQIPAHARDAEKPLNLRGAGGDHEPLATLHLARMSSEDGTQTGGVDELDVIEVEHKDGGRVNRIAFELVLQSGSGEQVEFPMKRQHGPVTLMPHLDLELLPHNHQ